MLIVATYFLPVELAAHTGAAFFLVYIAVRDRVVDGTLNWRRMAPVIGSAGSTGITKQKDSR
jgi:hypothetical protein